MAKAQADNPPVSKYLGSLKTPQKALVLKLRTAIRSACRGLQEDIKWGKCLTFSANGKNVIQTVVGKDKVTLIFFLGSKLDDPKGLLDGVGKKVRSARFNSTTFDRVALAKLVKQAVKLTAGSG